MRATAALHNCNADLGAALDALLDSGNIDTHTANAQAFSTAGA
jgi:hypothetical protein